MSYQSYTLEGAPLTSIFDREIEPAWGLNPYRTPNATCDTAGGYEIYVTRDGKGGWPNELKGLPQVGEKGVSTTMRGTTSVLGDLSIVILRFYNTQPPPLIWGGVQPPEISYSDDFGKTWRALEQCEDYERQRFNNILMRGGRAMHELQVRYGTDRQMGGTNAGWMRLSLPRPVDPPTDRPTDTLYPNHSPLSSASCGTTPTSAN